MYFSFFVGNLIARLISFFSILQCAFPSKCTMFRCAQKIVRPAIQIYYNNQRQQILNQILDYNRGAHLSMDGQYDSPGHSAYHCTVTAIESMSRKVIGFATVSKKEVNNHSPNAEPAAFRRLIDELSTHMQITSITTDNSPALNKMFREEYGHIKHYIDLWHILRNMFKKFSPKFKLRVRFFLLIFIYIFKF